jgi:GNAT superfamily N-acetyltransferase
MAIEIIPVRTSKQKKTFIDYEWQANRDIENWVSPLRMERNVLLDRKKNPFWSHADMEMFLAYNNGTLSGRIAAITNDNYNDFHNDKTGFWGFFECENNQETANALFEAAVKWLREKGRDNMLGPMNPSTNDECGVLIDGFDSKPYIMMRHNPAYYPQLMESFGNTKAKDLYAWFSTTKGAVENITDKMQRVATKIQQKYNLKIRNIKVKNLKQEIKLVKEVYNNAWSKNWGFVPFTDAEFDHIANDLKDIADEDLMLLAEKDGKPIGFSISLPNINEIMEKIPDGKLLPTGIFKLLTGLKKIKTVRVIILGVTKEFQHIGLGSIFYINTIRKAYEKGYTGGEMSWILEDNHPMNRAIEAFGSKIHKTYRIYGYPL